MIILGVDPGSRKTGWGVLRWEGSKVEALGAGTLSANPKLETPQRLRILHDGLSEVIADHQPEVASVETLFHAKNVKSALMLAQARGVLLLAIAQAGLPAYEYAPLDIKQSTVGYGRADKAQVEYMIRKILKIDERYGPDAFDALAAAFCHGARSRGSRA